MVRFAASWGLTFGCDPLPLLMCDVDDLSVLNEVLHVADERLKRVREEAMNGQR